MRRKGIHNERGIALILALVLALVVVGLAVGAIMLAGSTNLIGRFHVKDAEFRTAADAGIEWARDTINGTTTILPPLGFDTLQLRAPVRDASGNVVPGYTRSVFVGRSGATTGQFGVYASIIARIDDNAGRAVVVRRGELTQESFAKFARFDDTTTSGVVFRNGIQVFGPIHTNGVLYVGSSPGQPATFHGPATTAATISTAGNGVWKQGYRERVPKIDMPSPADLAALSAYATTGQTWLTGGAVGTTEYDPSTRIEFVAVDVNGDGDYVDDNEGFMRVYRANGTTANHLNYVTARRWNTGSATDPNATSYNCGDIVFNAGAPRFLSAGQHTTAATPANHRHNATLLTSQRLSLNAANPNRRCYLGGDPRLDSLQRFFPATPAPANYGNWIKWPGYGAGNAPATLNNKNIHPIARRRDDWWRGWHGRLPLADQPSVQPELQGRHLRPGKRGGQRCPSRTGHHRDDQQHHAGGRPDLRHGAGQHTGLRCRRRGAVRHSRPVDAALLHHRGQQRQLAVHSERGIPERIR